MTLVAVFLGLVLTGIACAIAIVLLAINAGPACPACGEETILIRASWLGRHTPWLEERLCTTCGWNGFTRRSRFQTTPGAPGRGATQPRHGLH